MKIQDESEETTDKPNVNNESIIKISSYLPIVEWLPKYTKMQGISDAIAGITLGLTMIPQSIAYAGLAGLSAQVRSFFIK